MLQGTNMIKWLTAAFVLSMLLATFGVAAHHSRATFFDMSRMIELEGEITRVQWRHPHVRYWIQAPTTRIGAAKGGRSLRALSEAV